MTFGRAMGSIALVDETLYVLGGFKAIDEKVECYNHESDEWNFKATAPVNRLNRTTIKVTKKLPYYLKGCTLRVFRGVLTNLESIAESD